MNIDIPAEKYVARANQRIAQLEAEVLQWQAIADVLQEKLEDATNVKDTTTRPLDGAE